MLTFPGRKEDRREIGRKVTVAFREEIASEASVMLTGFLGHLPPAGYYVKDVLHAVSH